MGKEGTAVEDPAVDSTKEKWWTALKLSKGEWSLTNI